MPRKEIDYSRCLIYKLCCNDPSIRDEYYGHTTDKTKRKYSHKSCCDDENNFHHNVYVYQFIRNNGGWNNWSMIVVEEYPCENRNQAEARERHWIETQRATLNKRLPTRTRQERYEENREENKEYIKQYRDEHKEEIRKHKNQNFECECGGKYTKSNEKRHLKSIKHMNYLHNLNNEVEE